MFSVEKIKKLNETEFQVYHYINEHIETVKKMTIRELAQVTHVSTATIVRVCRHLGYDGFAELKFDIAKNERFETSLETYYANFFELDSFLKGLTGQVFQEKLERVCRLIEGCDYCVFLGIGTSGALAKYGYRYFTNVGIQSFVITDPYFPITSTGYKNACLIILSVSGETKEILEQICAIKKTGAKIVSITNDENSTIAKLADSNFSYYMVDEFASTRAIKLTTQLPVLALIEIFAHNIKVEK
ncbi:RpiR family transcriptional regulator [Lactococcus hodotermopsidis]|uniref:RpiR family transcriptional regulator n=1 Tax=Pseudolactococcus hodotermopsidis TaxID=2709157 RepID=A0A6A0BDX4_9LACT|nr:MurR/RpiR family transcriptional regulator [Lactococcus hodotermopsidis]GFH42561.1 RpiR family transcriptional regulator [Lactococcus hodotermopsidis]